ncbi:MAG: glutathione binding-like protein, partial [Burkholderiaceae bacterium]
LHWVMGKRLGQSRFLAGNDYTIADIATWPWTRSWQNQGVELDDFPNVKRWFDTIAARAAAQRGVQVLAKARKPLTDDKARDVLFGSSQYARR